jgi:hypothetical protein
LAILRVVAATRIPLQNRGFLVFGQPGLQPRARQNGGLLQRIVQRFLEVVVRNDATANLAG